MKSCGHLVQAERIACAKALRQNRAQRADRTANMCLGLDLKKWIIMSSPGNKITTPHHHHQISTANKAPGTQPQPHHSPR